MLPGNQRMTTGVERVFRATFDGLYREIYLHWIHFLDSDGNIVRTKLDKSVKGRLYKVADTNERSQYGEVFYQFPEADAPVRLISLGMDREDQRYGRY